MKQKMTNKEKLIRLCVSAIMIALSTVLSLIQVVKLPFGGSITLLSMLPICMISLMYGVGWGFACGGIFGFIQMMFDLSYLSYGTWWGAVVAIILFDYIVAFGSLGIAGIFRNKVKSFSAAACLGVILACTLRFICHFITGVAIWGAWPDENLMIFCKQNVYLYSIVYNGAYMLPEMIATSVAAAIIFKFDSIKKLVK